MARHKRRSKRRQPAALARYWAGKRRAKPNPGRKRRRRSRKNPIVRAHRRRSPRSVSRRRAYRRNPGLPSTGFLMDAAYVTGGFFATRLAAGFVLPMIPGADSMPIMRIAGKGVVAWGLGFLGGKFLGQKAGQLLMLGGLVEVLSDAVRTYVSPFVPALGLESYPSLSSYPALGDRAYSDPYNVGNTVSDYDEAL